MGLVPSRAILGHGLCWYIPTSFVPHRTASGTAASPNGLTGPTTYARARGARARDWEDREPRVRRNFLVIRHSPVCVVSTLVCVAPVLTRHSLEFGSAFA